MRKKLKRFSVGYIIIFVVVYFIFIFSSFYSNAIFYKVQAVVKPIAPVGTIVFVISIILIYKSDGNTVIDDAIKTLKDIEQDFEKKNYLDHYAFDIVKPEIIKLINDNKKKYENSIKNGTNHREWLLSVIANISGDYLETGKYHIWRGILNDGAGKSLKLLFNYSIEQLYKEGFISEEIAEQQKRGLEDSISRIG